MTVVSSLEKADLTSGLNSGRKKDNQIGNQIVEHWKMIGDGLADVLSSLLDVLRRTRPRSFTSHGHDRNVIRQGICREAEHLQQNTANP